MKKKGIEHFLTHSIKPVLNSYQNQTRTHPKRRITDETPYLDAKILKKIMAN
jgi:hypothetical protein